MNTFSRSIALLAFFTTLPALGGEQSDDVFSLSLTELLQTKVAAASKFEESLEQTPVPVTLITQGMIESSSATTLRDLLVQYVPGFTPVEDQNEYNVAFRGIYTSSQQKILILLDGERINSYAYSSANPDHAISIDKIKQIEIIRGPGSAVYGNVALTAVVNLVLKSGQDNLGLTAKVAKGSRGVTKVYSQWGSVHESFELLAWAYYYQAEGEDFSITPEFDYSPTPSEQAVNVRLGAFDDRPALDVGASLKGSDWGAKANYRRAHYIEPFSSAGLSGEAYQYSDFPQFNGVGPGAESSWTHLQGFKSFQLGEKQNLEISLHYDENKIAAPLVISPSNLTVANVVWKEEAMGSKLEWSRYLDSGNLLFGLQFEQMDLVESEFAVYSNSQLTSPPIEVLTLGQESTASFYGQFKQEITPKWLMNLGGRFDVKDRLTGNSIEEFSPRVAFIFNDQNFDLKFSYSRAFVDPPYWNRYSALSSFRGSRDLEPEILESFQVSPEFVLQEQQLSVKLNLFFNRHSDFVFRNNAAAADQPIYTNAGEMETLGLEHEWQYQLENNLFKLVASHYQVESVEFYEARDDEIYNIPQTQLSFTWDLQIDPQLANQFNLVYLGERLSPINILSNGVPVVDPFPNQGVDFQLPENRLPGVALINWKMSWKSPNSPLTVSASIQNLTNKMWRQGGSTVHPYPQTGRWGQIQFAYRW
ncbi:TonB-dependent receptor [Aliikangiella marina]|uniref:TonB-dependent receptor n=1 Tax=Aliikangiella marina TaxID=1712262 RepID=A0A545TIB5_9GAMM|nr:TonB-dependent receptor [Aliikangiella marina]TQV76958.1 TonB-dependent receptor [Aliikangiella marina]